MVTTRKNNENVHRNVGLIKKLKNIFLLGSGHYPAAV
jgi:hypothetical protein